MAQATDTKQLAGINPQNVEQANLTPQTPKGRGTRLVQFSDCLENVRPIDGREGEVNDGSEIDETNNSLLKEAEEESRDLGIENNLLQRRLLALKKRRSTIGTKLFIDGLESQYVICLEKWNKAREELGKLQDDYDDEIDKEEDLVQQKEAESRSLQSEFFEYKWQVAREAEHRSSKRHLSTIFLEQLQLEDAQADEEIEKLRIRSRQLCSELNHIQRAIERKDQLPGGLFTVDYEHLRNENVSLNEKLTSKNKEVAEMVMKATHIIHGLAHFREKLQFVKKKTEADKRAVEAIDEDLNNKRLELYKIIEGCQNIRLKRSRLQTNDLNVRDSHLLDDMEQVKEQAEVMDKKLENIKSQYKNLVKYIKELQQIILQDASSYLAGTPEEEKISQNHARWGVKKSLRKPMVAASH